MERVAANVRFPCRNSDWGCVARVAHTEKARHEEACEFRAIHCPCPGATCNWQGSMSMVKSHFSRSHRNVASWRGEQLVFLASDVDLEGTNTWMLLQSCYHHRFLLVLEKLEEVEERPRYQMIGLLIGGREQADKFTIVCEVENGRRRLVWEGQVGSLADGVARSLQDHEGFNIDPDMVRWAVQQDHLRIRVTIRQILSGDSVTPGAQYPAHNPARAEIPVVAVLPFSNNFVDLTDREEPLSSSQESAARSNEIPPIGVEEPPEGAVGGQLAARVGVGRVNVQPPPASPSMGPGQEDILDLHSSPPPSPLVAIPDDVLDLHGSPPLQRSPGPAIELGINPPGAPPSRQRLPPLVRQRAAPAPDHRRRGHRERRRQRNRPPSQVRSEGHYEGQPRRHGTHTPSIQNCYRCGDPNHLVQRCPVQRQPRIRDRGSIRRGRPEDAARDATL